MRLIILIELGVVDAEYGDSPSRHHIANVVGMLPFVDLEAGHGDNAPRRTGPCRRGRG